MMLRYWLMFFAGFAWSVYQASVQGEEVLVLVGIVASAWAVRGTMRKDARRAWRRPATRYEPEALFPVLPVTEEEVVLDAVAEEGVPFYAPGSEHNWAFEERGRPGQTRDEVRRNPDGSWTIVYAPYPPAS